MSKLITREGAAGNGRPMTLEHEVWGDRLPFRFVKDDKVIAGKGRLAVPGQRQQRLPAPVRGRPEAFERPARVAWQRAARDPDRSARARLGASYHFLVVPENPTVYPEMLPDRIRGADERTVQQIMRQLEAERLSGTVDLSARADASRNRRGGAYAGRPTPTGRTSGRLSATRRSCTKSRRRLRSTSSPRKSSGSSSTNFSVTSATSSG